MMVLDMSNNEWYRAKPNYLPTNSLLPSLTPSLQHHPPYLGLFTVHTMTPMPRVCASSKKEGNTQPSPMEHHVTPRAAYSLAKEMGTPSTIIQVCTVPNVAG